MKTTPTPHGKTKLTLNIPNKVLAQLEALATKHQRSVQTEILVHIQKQGESKLPIYRRLMQMPGADFVHRAPKIKKNRNRRPSNKLSTK